MCERVREKEDEREQARKWNRNGGRSRNSAISDDPGQELGGMMTMIRDDSLRVTINFSGRSVEGK